MEALSRANLYANQATRLLDTEVEERFEVCRLANVELDKILLVEPQHHEALARKATFLTLTNQPAEALQVLDQLFELDRVEVKRQAELDAKLEEFYAAAQVARDNVGNAVLLDRAIDMMLAIARHYTDVDPPWPALIGAQYGDKKSPLRLLLLQLTVAETHEAAGDYAVARGEYEKMQAVIRSSRDRERPSNVEGTNVLDMESTCILMVLRGLSRSYYHLGEYEKAIEVVADKVRHRDVNGFHKLVALPLLALAEQKGFSIPTVVHGFSATLDGAIEVMYRGFVYEYQSDDSNTRANRALLQELCDKKAAMTSAAEAE
jgi:tetratricopeptide (TPR) repeat protein